MSEEPAGWRWRWVFKERGFGTTKWHIGERLSLNSPLRAIHQFEEEPLYPPTRKSDDHTSNDL